MKKLLMPLLATALIVTAAPAFAEDGPPHEGKKHDRFKEADKNTDGFLTKEEMLDAHKARIDKMFEKADLDKDGKLSKDEMEQGRAEMKKRWKEMREKAETSKKDGAKE